MKFLELYEKGDLLAAHRGASASYPENTLSAIKGAKNRCDFIEVDVQLSSDGKAVIVHDYTLLRTTNVIDIFKDKKLFKVSSFTLKELEQLDYGSWFYDNKKDKSEPLLTLYALLQFSKENNFYLNIEIKDLSESFKDKYVVDTIFNGIKELKMIDNVVISSFRSEYLTLIKKLSSDIVTALLVWGEHPGDLINYLKKLKVDAYHMSDDMVEQVLIDKLKVNGYFTGVYTVDSQSRKKELYSMGIDAVFMNI